MDFLFILAIVPSPAPISKFEVEVANMVFIPPPNILFNGPTLLKLAFSIYISIMSPVLVPQ